MFHAENGLCFERLEFDENGGFIGADKFGSVRVCLLSPGEDMQWGAGKTLAILPPSSWASVVASMTAIGENATTHAMFEAAQR